MLVIILMRRLFQMMNEPPRRLEGADFDPALTEAIHHNLTIMLPIAALIIVGILFWLLVR